MSDSDTPGIEVQRNNPLHGVKLEAMLTELLEHYSWEDLANAINLNCFKSNPSIKSSLKFLRKTPWAREKVEGFYLYKYKQLPGPDDAQYALPPRERTIPLDQRSHSLSETNATPPKSELTPEIPANVWDNWKKNTNNNDK